MVTTNSNFSSDAGLLVLRLGIGIIFLFHGVPKLLGGPETWGKLGLAMGNLGITFYPVFWGFMAAVAEGVGGFFLIIGFLVRPSAGMMTFTMIVATSMHYFKGDGFGKYSHSLSLAVVFLALMIMGGGRWALGAQIKFLENRWYQ